MNMKVTNSPLRNAACPNTMYDAIKKMSEARVWGRQEL